MARVGVPVAEVHEALETAVGGEPVATLVEGSYAIDVAVYYPDELRASAEAIGAITVPTPSGARVPLRQLAAIWQAPGPVQVNRERAQRFVAMQVNLIGRDPDRHLHRVRRSVRESGASHGSAEDRRAREPAVGGRWRRARALAARTAPLRP